MKAMKEQLERLCKRIGKKYKVPHYRIVDQTGAEDPCLPDFNGNPIGVTANQTTSTKMFVGFGTEPIEDDNDAGQTEWTMLVLSNTGYFKPEKVFYFFGRGSMGTGSPVDWQLDECGEFK